MKIKSLQVTRKTEEIVKRYLLGGTYPTFRTITKELSDWLQGHTPGVPSFVYRKIQKKSLSNSERFNEDLHRIDQDVKDSYEASIYQSNALMQNFTQGQIERDKLRHELEKVNNQIDELLTISKFAESKYVNEQIIGIEDMSLLNIKDSTADIDLAKKEVTLRERKLSSRRVQINPNQVKLEILQPYHSHDTLEKLTYAFDDSVNTAWWETVRTKEMNVNNKMELALIVSFADLTALNTIEYLPHHTKEMTVQLEYSTDGIAYTPIVKQTEEKSVNLRTWRFPTIKARTIKMRFTKYQYDERALDAYVYYFGAKNISMYEKSYEEESVLYSQQLNLPKNAKNLSILTEEENAEGTFIEYEVSLNPSELAEERIWHRMDSGDKTNSSYAKAIQLSNLEPKKVEARRSVATGEIVNGMQSFKLINQNGKSIISEDENQVESFSALSNAKLYRGLHQWKRERIYVPFNGDMPLNYQWDKLYTEKANLIKRDYYLKGNNLKFNAGTDNFYRFSICIYSNNSRQLPLGIQLVETVLNGVKKRLGSYSVYCNKNRLIPSNDEVTLSFERGWNEIQILYHLGDVLRRSDITVNEMPEGTYLGKLNIAGESMVRGDLLPMVLTEKNNLFHNISPRNNDYFAVDERQVILNYQPNNTVFQLVYDEEKTAQVEMPYIIRATLKRAAGIDSITPRLKRIRIRSN